MKWVVLASLLVVYLRQQPSLEVKVKGGLVRGAVSRSGRYLEFLGLPYAYTDAEHRFQEALPVPEWDDVFDSVNEHIRCPQRYAPNLILGQENCLTLNVYTPLAIIEPLPVMVYFHGGGFREGAGGPFLYGPDFLVDKGVVLVIPNYRLEILGFLCLGIKEAPGNIGLKDQVLALKWVQENIRAFGGDPDNVTIFGESAGAASVSYHIISPMSKGLFKRSIMQSGTSIAPWSFQFEPLEIAKNFTRQLGLESNDPLEIYEFLKNKSPDKLLKTRVPREEGNVITSENIFVPCIDKDIDGIVPFLPDYPYNIMEKGNFTKVPLVIGYNSAEGYMFAGKENRTTLSKFDITTALPRDLEFPTHEEKYKIAERVKLQYKADNDIFRTNKTILGDFEGDPFFKYPLIATTDLILKHSKQPVYSYKFSYGGWLNIAKIFFGFGMYPGATHADEIFYLFKTQVPLPWLLEREMIERMTTMWTNFAKYGDPTPEQSTLLPMKWSPANPTSPHTLVIDKEFSTMPIWDDEVIQFWHEVYTKYRRKS